MFSGKEHGTEYAFGVVSLKQGWRFPTTACHVQLVNPDRVFGKKHLVHCILLTVKAFGENASIASTPELELLVRLSGTRQLSEAIRGMEPRGKAVLIVFGKNATRCYKSALEQLGTKELRSTLEKNGEKDAMERAALVGVS